MLTWQDEYVQGSLERNGISYKVLSEKDTLANSRVFMSRYPFAVGRIDWGRMVGVVEGSAFLCDSSGGMSEHEGLKLKEFLGSIFEEIRFSRDNEVIFCGDDMSCDVVLSCESAICAAPVVFPTDQHVYVLPMGFEWCIHFSLLRVLTFGFPPSM